MSRPLPPHPPIPITTIISQLAITSCVTVTSHPTAATHIIQYSAFFTITKPLHWEHIKRHEYFTTRSEAASTSYSSGQPNLTKSSLSAFLIILAMQKTSTSTTTDSNRERDQPQ